MLYFKSIFLNCVQRIYGIYAEMFLDEHNRINSRPQKSVSRELVVYHGNGFGQAWYKFKDSDKPWLTSLFIIHNGCNDNTEMMNARIQFYDKAMNSNLTLSSWYVSRSYLNSLKRERAMATQSTYDEAWTEIQTYLHLPMSKLLYHLPRDWYSIGKCRKLLTWM